MDISELSTDEKRKDAIKKASAQGYPKSVIKKLKKAKSKKEIDDIIYCAEVFEYGD